MSGRSPTSDDLVSELRRKIRPDLVVTTPEILENFRADRSGLRSDSAPMVVVFAETSSDVVEVMMSATAHRVPVVVRGTGTGVAGASFASAGELVLSLERMNRILEINEEEAYAIVEPGVINGDLNDVLRDRGFWFAPDPASRAISSIGGNIATNAGGLMCAKYGVTREAVLGLTVVLADGSMIETGRRTMKGVTGLDLTALVTGSEGTLGVIVSACVRIRRAVPGGVSTVNAYFPSARDAANACLAVSSAGLTPMVMEIMDDQCLAAVHAYLELDSPPSGSASLLLQFDGESSTANAASANDILRRHGGRPETATDEAHAEELLRIRRSVHPAMARLGTTLIEDVCVPRTRLADMFDRISEIQRQRGIVIPTVAHAGDGNLHPNFISQTDAIPEEIWDAAQELFSAALEFGGTLTGEHGVGTLKKRWLRQELGDTQVELQRRIKAAFDPLNILNPGKVF